MRGGGRKNGALDSLVWPGTLALSQDRRGYSDPATGLLQGSLHLPPFISFQTPHRGWHTVGT